MSRKHMGDDLTEAGEFITSAMTQMDLLLSDIRLDHEKIEPMLAALQESAKTAHARGIFRAAQRVSESYNNGHSQPKIDGRLMSLYKLVVQYHAGWLEIVPVIQAPSEPETQDPEAQDYETAKATLIALLPFGGAERASLESLIGLDLSASLSPAPVPALTPTQAEPTAQFETVMPDIINEALRRARAQGKSVSLSYAAEDLQLSPANMAYVYNRLDEIVSDFIFRKIGTPSQRAQQGLPRSGHIDISAAASGSKEKLTVSCEGEQQDIAIHKSAPPARTVQDERFSFEPHLELGT